MDLVYIPIGAVRPYEFNSRRHDETQIARIAASIKEFGFNQPIVTDESGEVLVGHGRLFAAQKLGLFSVPVVRVAALSEAQKKAYRVLDNKLQNDSSWDFDNLGLELGFMEDHGIDLKSWGLDELRDLMLDEKEVTEDNFDLASQDDAEIYVKRGDLIELGKHRVVCGDSTKSGDVDALKAGGAPILMVTDPPYGVDYDPMWRAAAGVSHNEAKMGKVTNDDNADWFEAWDLCGTDVGYVWHASCQTSTVLTSLERAGFEAVSMIIWNKERFALSRSDYHYKHEPCWYVVRKGRRHNWQGARDQCTVWDINAREDSGHGHGTQKPIECMGRPIKNNSGSGDSIYDPFLGSGTTLIAAEQLGRTCYGIEIDPRYCQVVIERYRKHCIDYNKKFECKINGTPKI
jgi:DNA modification methylase